MTGKQPAEAAAAYATAAQRPVAEGGDGADGGAAEEAQTGAAEPARHDPAEHDPTATAPTAEAPAAAAGEAELSDEGPNHQLVEHDLDELAARAEKADEYLELAQRTRADFDNYRKRAAREAALAQDRGIARLAKELLPAIDNLDRAVRAAETVAAGAAVPEGVESQLVSGIKLVQADLLAGLARAGIEPFSPVGEPFDPQWHEAVAQHPVPGSLPGTIVEVYQQGYRLGETVLRPARVLVAA